MRDNELAKVHSEKKRTRLICIHALNGNKQMFSFHLKDFSHLTLHISYFVIYQINYIPLHRIYARFFGYSLIHSSYHQPFLAFLSPLSEHVFVVPIPSMSSPAHFLHLLRLLPREMNEWLAERMADWICSICKSIPTPEHTSSHSYISHFMKIFP